MPHSVESECSVLSDYSNLEKICPILSGEKDSVAFCVVRYAVQDTGAKSSAV